MPICNKNNKIRCQSSAVHDMSNAFIAQLLRNAPHVRLRQQIRQWIRHEHKHTLSWTMSWRADNKRFNVDFSLSARDLRGPSAVGLSSCMSAPCVLRMMELGEMLYTKHNQCQRSSFAYTLNDVLDCVVRPTAQQSRLWWRTCFASRTSVDAPCPQIDSYRADFSVVPTIIINNGGVFFQQTY